MVMTTLPVRIDMLEGRTDDERKLTFDTLQDCVVEAFGVPERDCYQIVHEHKKGRMVFLDTGMNFERCDGVAAIQLFSSPRTHVEKMKVFELLSDRLGETCRLEPMDLFMSVFTNRDEDWSFGDGEAEYVTGKLP